MKLFGNGKKAKHAANGRRTSSAQSQQSASQEWQQPYIERPASQENYSDYADSFQRPVSQQRPSAQRSVGTEGQKKQASEANTRRSASQSQPVSPQRSGDQRQAYPTAQRPAARRQPGGAAERSPEEQAAIKRRMTQYKRFKRRRRILIVLIILALIVLGVTIWWTSSVRPPDIGDPSTPTPDGGDSQDDPNTAVSSSSDLNSVRKDGVYTFLVVGSDDGNGNTDTMMVGMLDTVNQKLDVVSIPRDTLVNVDWPVKKANTILSLNGNGVEGLKAGLSDILGYMVDCYVVIDLNAFVELVDMVGGVYFDVPQDMDYDDDVQDLHIHVSAGPQWLDGETALGVVRFRSGYANADLGRIETQQAFLSALADQVLQPENLLRINEFAQIFAEYVDTDLTIGNLIWLGQQIMSLSSEDINFHTMPLRSFGDNLIRGLSYVAIDEDQWVEMLNTYINPLREDIQVEDLNILTCTSDGTLYVTNGNAPPDITEFYDNTGSSSSVSTTSDDEEEETVDEETVAPPSVAESPATSDPDGETSTDPDSDVSTGPGASDAEPATFSTTTDSGGLAGDDVQAATTPPLEAAA